MVVLSFFEVSLPAILYLTLRAANGLNTQCSTFVSSQVLEQNIFIFKNWEIRFRYPVKLSDCVAIVKNWIAIDDVTSNTQTTFSNGYGVQLMPDLAGPQMKMTMTSTVVFPCRFSRGHDSCHGGLKNLMA